MSMTDLVPVQALPLNRSNVETALADWAAKAGRAHTQVKNANRNALEHALTAGDALRAAREAIGHGDWEHWVRESTGIPPRTASQYQLLAEHRPTIEKGKSAGSADLTISAALRRIRPTRSASNKPRRKLTTAAALAWTDAPEARVKFVDMVGAKPLCEAIVSLPDDSVVCWARALWDHMSNAQQDAFKQYLLTQLSEEVCDVAA
jgi:hypothetical protein